MPSLSDPHAFDRLVRVVGAYRTRKPAKSAVKEAAGVFVEAVQEELDHEGSGRIYPSKTGEGEHQASAPGEPPAPDTYELQRSVRAVPSTGTTYKVIVDHHAAAILEYGSMGRVTEQGGTDGFGGKIEPRPFLRPARKRAEPLMKKIIAESVKKTTARTLK
jgi:hypothetical protein